MVAPDSTVGERGPGDPFGGLRRRTRVGTGTCQL